MMSLTLSKFVKMCLFILSIKVGKIILLLAKYGDDTNPTLLLSPLYSYPYICAVIDTLV